MITQQVPYGFCHCGCGQKTKISKFTDKSRKRFKGQPYNFIQGHNPNKRGRDSYHWKGGRKIFKGYIKIYHSVPPHNNKAKYIFEHILVVEKILGKHLPPKSKIHHINENKTDNRPQNLVLCQDNAYHLFLHKRIKALRACGHTSWLKCWVCKQYDDPLNMYVNKNRVGAFHRSCINNYSKNLRKRKQMLQVFD